MWSGFLGLVQLACWVLTALIFSLLVTMVMRRRLRRRYLQRLDEWRRELSEQLPVWLQQGQCPRTWLREAGRRELLVEALLERVEGSAGRERDACQRALEKWGLVDQQIATLRHSQGLGRARALIGLGRMRQRRALPLLAEFLDDFHPDVRLAAVRALGMQGSPEAAESLLALLDRGPLRVSVPSWQRALINCCETEPERLLPHLESLSRRPQALLMRVLAEVVTPELLPRLERFLTAREPETRAELARALGRIPGAATLALLARLLRDPVWFVQVRALRALGEIGGWQSVELLLEGLTSEHPEVRRAAAESLARQPLPLDELLRRAQPRLTPPGRQALLGALTRQGLFWMLAEQLASPVAAVRALAVEWLTQALAAGAHKTLLDALSHPKPEVAERVADFLACRGSAQLLADLEELWRRTPADSPLGRRLARVREEISLRSAARR